jgi:hypothetical protein
VGITGYIGAAISIVAGLLGLMWPAHVSRTIGLEIPGRLGTAEVRATYGGLFIGMGIAVVLVASRDAALVLGAAWAGAFIARAVSFVIDRSRSRENVAGLVIEGTIAALLLLS